MLTGSEFFNSRRLYGGISGFVDLDCSQFFFKFPDDGVLGPQLSFIVNALGPQLRFKFLNARVEGSDLDFIFLDIGANINAG